MARPSYEELLAENQRLQQRVADLEGQLRQLAAQLQEALRATKRQAAPFSKGPPKANPNPDISR